MSLLVRPTVGVRAMGAEMEQGASLEIPFSEYAGAVRRQWRFLAIGLVSLATLVLLAAFLLPRGYRAEATLSIPDVAELKGGLWDERPPEPVPAGMPIALYKKLDRSLGDARILEGRLGAILTRSELVSLRRGLGRHVGPLSSTVRNELVRIERDDTIVGILLSIEGPSADASRERILRLADLVRDQLLFTLAFDTIDSDLLHLRTRAQRPARQILVLTGIQASLDQQARDLQVLAGRAEGRADGAPRELVSTAEGGHRYLSPGLQIVGTRAMQAENDHSIRVLRLELARSEALVAFLMRLRESLLQAHNELHRAGSASPDLPGLVRRELQATVEDAPEEAVAESLRAEAEGLASALEIVESGFRFIESPSPVPRPRALATLAGLAAGAVLLLLAAFLRDFWSRSRPKG